MGKERKKFPFIKASTNYVNSVDRLLMLIPSCHKWTGLPESLSVQQQRQQLPGFPSSCLRVSRARSCFIWNTWDEMSFLIEVRLIYKLSTLICPTFRIAQEVVKCYNQIMENNFFMFLKGQTARKNWLLRLLGCASRIELPKSDRTSRK